MKLDGKRLDWLQEKKGLLEIEAGVAWVQVYHKGEHRSFSGKDARSAIDKAMKGCRR